MDIRVSLSLVCISPLEYSNNGGFRSGVLAVSFRKGRCVDSLAASH